MKGDTTPHCDDMPPAWRDRDAILGHFKPLYHRLASDERAGTPCAKTHRRTVAVLLDLADHIATFAREHNRPNHDLRPIWTGLFLYLEKTIKSQLCALEAHGIGVGTRHLPTRTDLLDKLSPPMPMPPSVPQADTPSADGVAADSGREPAVRGEAAGGQGPATLLHDAIWGANTHDLENATNDLDARLGTVQERLAAVEKYTAGLDGWQAAMEKRLDTLRIEMAGPAGTQAVAGGRIGKLGNETPDIERPPK